VAVDADAERFMSVCIVLNEILVDNDRGCSGETGVSTLSPICVHMVIILRRRDT
jgi:hypothetical protein